MSLDYVINFFKGAHLVDQSHFLAQFLGIWLIVFSLYTFFKHEHLRAALEEVEDSPAFQLTWALTTFFLGLLLLLLHPTWEWHWPVLITIIAWILTIMGILRLFLPENFFKPSLRLFEGSLSYVGASIWLVVGVILSWWGFHTP